MSPSNNVAVIGAGAAGLVTARQLKRVGLSPVVFEAEPALGGTWTYTDDVESDPLSVAPDRERVHTSMYANLHTNLPRDLMAFREYPFDARGGGEDFWPRFPAHTQVLTYLSRYAAHFEVNAHIRFDTKVESVLPLGATGRPGADSEDLTTWLVRSSSPDTGPQEEHFDAVAVCNGHFSVPKVPDLPGASSFGGFGLHSHNYRRPEVFAEKKVVLLGGRASGVDIAIEVAEHASETVVCARDGRTGQSLPGCSDIQVRPAIERFDGDDVVLTDGGRIESVDVLVYCTGYQYALPFLANSSIVEVDEGWIHPLYLDLFSSVTPSLGFIGLGNMIIPFPQYELQAMAFAAVVAGTVSLPSRAERERATQEYEAVLRGGSVPERHFLTQGDEQFAYNDLLADQFGIERISPNFEAVYHAVQRARMRDLKRYRLEPLPWLDREYGRRGHAAPPV